MAGMFAERGVAIMSSHPDTGCADGGPSCLSCTLPQCVHDMKATARNLLDRQRRDEDIWRLFDTGLSLNEIGRQVGTSGHAVRRAIDRRQGQ